MAGKNTLPGAKQIDALLKDTKAFRQRLNTHTHFVALTEAAISLVISNNNDGIVAKSELDAIMAKIYSQFPKSEGIDIKTTRLDSVFKNNRLKSKSIPVYSGSELLGVLTSTFDNASSIVVRFVQAEIKKDLAVGHVVKESTQANIGSETYIHNNIVFRSPLSMKLSTVSEMYNIYYLHTNNKSDTFIDIYFNKIEGSSYYEPNGYFIFLTDTLGSIFGTKLTSLAKIGKVSKTAILEGLSIFSRRYFSDKYKNAKFLSTNLDAQKIQAVENRVIEAIKNISIEHENYLNRAIKGSSINKEFEQELTRLSVIFTLPQTADFNSKVLAGIETGFARTALNWVKEHALGFVSSPSFKDHIYGIISDLVVNGKSKRKFKQSTQFLKEDLVLPQVATIKGKSTKTKKSEQPKKVATLAPLRSAKGQFTSIVNIQRLLSARLTQTIKENMKPPALVNRTGRFAESVELKSVQRDQRSGAITAFLSYMKYPYATFEPGGRQGSSQRSPTRLIERSVREIAKDLVTQRMRIVVD